LKSLIFIENSLIIFSSISVSVCCCSLFYNLREIRFLYSYKKHEKISRDITDLLFISAATLVASVLQMRSWLSHGLSYLSKDEKQNYTYVMDGLIQYQSVWFFLIFFSIFGYHFCRLRNWKQTLSASPKFQNNKSSFDVRSMFITVSKTLAILSPAIAQIIGDITNIFGN